VVVWKFDRLPESVNVEIHPAIFVEVNWGGFIEQVRQRFGRRDNGLVTNDKGANKAIYGKEEVAKDCP